MPKKDPVLAALRHMFGDAVTTLEQGGLSQVSEVIPTGIDALDYGLLGIGGLPVGRTVEMYGGEGSGKSSLVYKAIAAAQRHGARTILGDSERNVEKGRAIQFGVDPSKLILLDMLSMERTVRAFKAAVSIDAGPSDPPTLLVWDSLASTPTRDELRKEKAKTPDEADEEILRKAMGVRARLVGILMRVMGQRLGPSKTSFLVVNQMRQKIGVMYGDKTTTPGGDAPKYHASVRFRLTMTGRWKVGTDPVGQFVQAEAQKSRWSAPWQKFPLRLRFADGFDNDWSTIELAIQRGVLKPKGKGKLRTPGGKVLSRTKDSERLARIARKRLWPKAPV